MQVCYWTQGRGVLLRDQVDAVPATGETVTLPSLGLVGTVGQRDFATAPDGGEELLIELQLTMSFDEYCEQHNIQPGEYGAAFAAYLHEISGGEWDGDAHRVNPS